MSEAAKCLMDILRMDKHIKICGLSRSLKLIHLSDSSRKSLLFVDVQDISTPHYFTISPDVIESCILHY